MLPPSKVSLQSLHFKAKFWILLVLNRADVSGPSSEIGCSEWMQNPAVRFVGADKHQTCVVIEECGSFIIVKQQFVFVALVLPGGYELVPQQRIKIIL